MQPGVFGQAARLFFVAKATTGVVTTLVTLTTFCVGTQTQDGPVGMHTQVGEVGQHSPAACPTLVAVTAFFVTAAFGAAAAGQLLVLQADWLQIALAFLGASVANVLTEINRNRAERTAEMRFFMMKI